MIVDPQNEDDGQTAITELMDDELRTQLARFMEKLTPIEKDILAKRFGLGEQDEHQLEKIGNQYDLSRERIRQIQSVAIEKLRHAFKRTHRGRPGLSK
jgi:RNA polymerase sigma factor (sigma-70 family)